MKTRQQFQYSLKLTRTAEHHQYLGKNLGNLGSSRTQSHCLQEADDILNHLF